MARNRGTTSQGQPFDQDTINAVWNKGTIIPKYDPKIWRRDICGSNMKFTEYGNTDSQEGWEIDHIKPVSKGGMDDLANLEPLYWDDNRKKGDTDPWNC
jgi:5-methylcytosine-specific restriction endonuclease McrA